MTQMTNEPRNSNADFYVQDRATMEWELFDVKRDPWQEGTADYPPYVDELRSPITTDGVCGRVVWK